jgi:hypothetical protein
MNPNATASPAPAKSSGDSFTWALRVTFFQSEPAPR